MERSRSFLLQLSQPPHANMFRSVIILGGILIAFLFAYAAYGEEPEYSSTLKHASIIFRHGEKTPTSTYPMDPYKEAIFWPEGWGQLTKNGKKQMFQLGEILRSRYGKFIGLYSSETVRVDSSDHDRCHQSAGALLAALFPPQGDQVWNSQLMWQPIPVHAAPLQSDKVIVVKSPCPLYRKEKMRSDAELAARYDEQNAELYQYLTEHTGQNITTLLEVETLFNVLEIEKELGKTLPEWTASVYPDKMKDIAALVLASFTYTPIMKRLYGGPLLKAIITNLNSNFNGLSKKLLSLYAAHDITIVNVRRALGFDDVTFKPQLGAALIVELHVVNTEPQVKLYYIENWGASVPVQWEVPNCSSPCTLAQFSQAMVTNTPVDWDTECQST